MRAKSMRGQAMIEFALILPLLMLLVMGVADLGRGIYAHNIVASMAREGARYGTSYPDKTDDIRAVVLKNTAALDPNEITLGPDWLTCSPICTSGNTITIIVRYRFQPVTLFFSSFNFTGKATMTIE